MAIQTTATLFNEGICLWRIRNRSQATRTSNPGSTMTTVALIADERRTSLEQVVGNGAVRLMTIGAVVGDRLVVMHERTTLFHVAGVAGFDHAIALHELGTGRTVGIVAIRTGHLALDDRVMGRLVDLSTLLLVAAEAHFRLGALVANLVLRSMNLVAARAGNIAGFMGTSGPQMALGILLVA